MNENMEEPFAEAPPKKNRTVIIVIAALAVLCCCCLFAIVALYYGYDSLGDPLGFYGFLPILGQMLA